jgi:hypothetical protein
MEINGFNRGLEDTSNKMIAAGYFAHMLARLVFHSDMRCMMNGSLVVISVQILELCPAIVDDHVSTSLYKDIRKVIMLQELFVGFKAY